MSNSSSRSRRRKRPPQPASVHLPPKQSTRGKRAHIVKVTPFEAYFFQKGVGWIHINLIIGGRKRLIWASAVFPPFEDFFKFVEAVAASDFPAECEINEEGESKRFIATAMQDPELFRLVIRDPYTQLVVFEDAVFSRRQFVSALYNDFIDFKITAFDPGLWGALVPDIEYISLVSIRNWLMTLDEEGK